MICGLMGYGTDTSGGRKVEVSRKNLPPGPGRVATSGCPRIEDPQGVG